MNFIISFSVFVLDRVVKLLILRNLKEGLSIHILSYFDITNLVNSGMAFSLFCGNNKSLLIINAAVVLIIGIVILTDRIKKGLSYNAYGFIIGGAISNLWDRIFYGGVIDYLDFRVFPVFNLADTAITIGAGLIIISMLTDKKDKYKSGVYKNVS